MTDDLIGRAEAQTAIQFAAKRYTVAHEAHGEVLKRMWWQFLRCLRQHMTHLKNGV